MKFWAWAAVLLAALWTLGAFALGYEAVFMPGELSAFHTSEGFAQEAARVVASGSHCRACHDFGGKDVDNKCIACHPKQAHVIAGHRPERLRQFPRLPQSQLTCFACHAEHRGSAAQLKVVTNETCEKCHFRKHTPDENEGWKKGETELQPDTQHATLPLSKAKGRNTQHENCISCHVQHADVELKEKP
jgi:hypothetical protein